MSNLLRNLQTYNDVVYGDSRPLPAETIDDRPMAQYKAHKSRWYKFCNDHRLPYIVVGRYGQSYYVEVNCDPCYFIGGYLYSISENKGRQIVEYWRASRLRRNAECTFGGGGHHMIANGFIELPRAEQVADEVRRSFDYHGGAQWGINKFLEKENNNMVKFFKDGKALSLQTDAMDEAEFTGDFTLALQDFMTRPDFEGPYQIERWLKSYAEICCKLRGYKADVKEQRLLTVGDMNPASEALVSVAEHGSAALRAVA